MGKKVLLAYRILYLPHTIFILLIPLALVLPFAAGCSDSLHDYAMRGELDQMRALIEHDAQVLHSPDRIGKTPLHHAVSFKQEASMALLLESGADINATDNTGMTPLHTAAMLGRKEAIWLVDHGADIEARDAFGDTPVHTAAVFGRTQVVKFLASRGAALDAPNAAGLTPLDLATKHRHEETCAYLRQ